MVDADDDEARPEDDRCEGTRAGTALRKGDANSWGARADLELIADVTPCST